MILNKLQEAIAEVDQQRKALDKVESQLRSMIAELSGTPFLTRASAPVAVSPSTSTPQKKKDHIEMIADIINTEGKPMHINFICERMSAIVGHKVERTKIEPGLNRHISKVKAPRVVKVAPSTYAIPEMTAYLFQPPVDSIAS
jgi:hypothetical protein